MEHQYNRHSATNFLFLFNGCRSDAAPITLCIRVNTSHYIGILTRAFVPLWINWTDAGCGCRFLRTDVTLIDKMTVVRLLVTIMIVQGAPMTYVINCSSCTNIVTLNELCLSFACPLSSVFKPWSGSRALCSKKNVHVVYVLRVSSPRSPASPGSERSKSRVTRLWALEVPRHPALSPQSPASRGSAWRYQLHVCLISPQHFTATHWYLLIWSDDKQNEKHFDFYILNLPNIWPQQQYEHVYDIRLPINVPVGAPAAYNRSGPLDLMFSYVVVACM